MQASFERLKCEEQPWPDCGGSHIFLPRSQVAKRIPLRVESAAYFQQTSSESSRVSRRSQGPSQTSPRIFPGLGVPSTHVVFFFFFFGGV